MGPKLTVIVTRWVWDWASSSTDLLRFFLENSSTTWSPNPGQFLKQNRHNDTSYELLLRFLLPHASLPLGLHITATNNDINIHDTKAMFSFSMFELLL